MKTSYRHTILNVDDDEGARYTKTRIFERAGYRVLEAATGGDALSLVHDERPQLVLLDVGLPDINGIEICRRIKKNAASKTHDGAAGFRVLREASGTGHGPGRRSGRLSERTGRVD